MTDYITLFFLLIGLHCLADYPLQGDFLARGKNFMNPIPGIPWYQCMFAHSAIHSLFVVLATGYPILGLYEFGMHFIIDCIKCKGLISYNVDQLLHIVCKMCWVLYVYNGCVDCMSWCLL